MPDEYKSRTALSFVIDTNTVDDMSLEMVRLRDRHTSGWINLTRTDTMDTELGGTSDEEKRERLLAQSRPYVEHFGPIVIDHSRLDFCVVGSSEDEERLGQVFGILFPGVDPRAARRQHTRDAMHIATAIRYAATAFVSKDEDLLKRDAGIRAAFDNFRILSPAAALDLAERQVAKVEEHARRMAEEG